MKYLKDIKNLEGVKVLVRLDLNVPIKDGKIEDDFRIRKILPTIAFLREQRAKIILMSHIETSVAVKAENKKEEKPTLVPVCEYLNKQVVACKFIKNYKDAVAEIEKMPVGGIVLLENLRDHEGETKNDKKFAKELASLADIYVNEAFAVSHRAHASVSAITAFIPSYAGILFQKEIENLSSAFNPDRPFLFILGGAKFETKLPLIEKFMKIADKVFVGGALANNFFKEQGKEVGKSLVSPENFNLVRFTESPKLLLPVDEVWENDKILDAGPRTVELLKAEISKAKHILWNGPVGLYEKGFKEPTIKIAHAVAEATKKGAKSILGGGDTLATLAELKMENEFTFVSTGGGAMLEFLAKGTLPGIEALEKSL